ncbi:hypothetical protein B0T18DRAFT_386454 [Schizothecium vesticola]|uniref:Uncharacterized protein n=1 Tax=Schizothecium vesticola TaxID=314040 RepID=A0AA40KCY7_9PEZI|nr:hypothetical protein B0T18DRAFT_386454 [Schizothecium vesticola]
MHRIRPRRSRKTSQLSWSSTDSMVAIPSSPTTSSTMSLRGSARNTGFPDSFDGHRNTCLPHPDAIIAPDATLTEADITLARASARHRMSIQANQARAAAADPHQLHPVITDSTYCASPTAISNSHDSAVSRLALSSLRGVDLSRSKGSTNAHDHYHGKSDADSLHSGGSASPTHPPARAGESGGRGKKRRRSLLARLTHR